MPHTVWKNGKQMGQTRLEPAELEIFAEMLEWRTAFEAAQNVGEIVLCDSRAERLVWDSMAISDVRLFADLVRASAPPTFAL